MSLKLLPCPFCGGEARIKQQGTAKQSCIIACQDCDCHLESGEVWSMGQQWNTRHVLPDRLVFYHVMDLGARKGNDEK